MHRESEEFRQGVSARMASGATWTVGIRLCERLIGVLSLVILARLLVPDDFGLLALATTLVAAVELLGSFSFDLWLINQSRHSRADLDTVWTLGILRGLIAALVLALLAGPAALFFDAPRVHDIVLVLALGTVVMGFENAGVILFRKELEFDRDFRLVVTTKLTGFVVTIVTAFALRSYWALVIGVMTAKVARVVLSYLMHPHRPRPDRRVHNQVPGSRLLRGSTPVERSERYRFPVCNSERTQFAGCSDVACQRRARRL